MTQEKKIKEANMSLTLELLEFFKKFRDEAVASHTQKIVEMCEGMKVESDNMKHDLHCKCDFEKNTIIDDIIEGIKKIHLTK